MLEIFRAVLNSGSLNILQGVGVDASPREVMASYWRIGVELIPSTISDSSVPSNWHRHSRPRGAELAIGFPYFVGRL